MLESAFSLSPTKQKLLGKTWAWRFRDQCLPLIDEGAFASCYCENNGRPNASVRVVVAMLILKEVFNYTDEEIIEAVAFDLRFQTALGLTMDDAVPCQKTLHNFRVKLTTDERVEKLFCDITDQLLKQLGLETDRARLDSTQICSNIRLLSRLSRFCVTFRMLLRLLKRHAPALLGRISERVRLRYLRADDTDSSYDNTGADEGRRRLGVCARDNYRLVMALRGVELPAQVAECYLLLERLLEEQCLVLEVAATPVAEDADIMEERVPVRLRGKGEVPSACLQTPHDPDATYGHKGVGFAVTFCETVGNGDKPEMITHIVITESYASDMLQTVPAVEALIERSIAPKELVADTGYGSTANLLACQELGTTLIAPVHKGATTLAGPKIYIKCLPDAPPTACSMGVIAASTERKLLKKRVHYLVSFTEEACAGCPNAPSCPALKQADGSRLFQIEELDAMNTLRRYIETTTAFKEKYRWRSGIEATNSECKRAHGLAKLRVRGKERVKVAVFLKGLACNVKRAMKYWQRDANTAINSAFLSLIWLNQRCTSCLIRPHVSNMVSKLNIILPQIYRFA